MNRLLWVLQVLLGIYFLSTGVIHFMVPPGLPAPMAWMYRRNESVQSRVGRPKKGQRKK